MKNTKGNKFAQITDKPNNAVVNTISFIYNTNLNNIEHKTVAL